MRISLLALGMACLFTGCLAAQDNADLLNRMKAMEARIQALEAEVQGLKAQQAAMAAAPPAPAAAPAVAPEAAVPVAAPQLGGAGGAAAKALNPDISVIGDFLGGIGNPANRYTPSLEMHESELGLQAIIDPYARGDFFLTFGEEGVGLEEGYITFTALTGSAAVEGRQDAGGFRQGQHAAQPRAALDGPPAGDPGHSGRRRRYRRRRPLAEPHPAGPRRHFSGRDGAGIPGRQHAISSKPGNAATSRQSGTCASIATLSESTNIDLGGSFARGHSPFGDGWNQLYGIDATLRWKPLRRAIYRSFVGRSEWVWARTVAAPGVLTPFGFYVSGDYQLGGAGSWAGDSIARKGARVCRRIRRPTASARATASIDCCGYWRLLVLTYWPSEFSQIRGQLRRTRYGEGLTANEIAVPVSVLFGGARRAPVLMMKMLS